MINIYAKDYEPNVTANIINIGHQGENEARSLIFDLSDYEAEYGEGSFSVVNRRPGDGEVSYVVTKTEHIKTDDISLGQWIITNIDTAKAGEGRVELRYIVDDVVVKTDVFRTMILPSLVETGDIPEPLEDLVEKIAELTGKAEAAAAEAKTSESNAEAWAVGQRDGVDVASDDETYLNNSKYYAGLAEAAAKQSYQQVFGVKWDRLTNRLTRTRDAVGITTDTTNFCHKGTINTAYQNPFDMIYPWSEMMVCNVDLTKYRSGNYTLKECISAVYGDPDFTYYGSDTLFVGRYRPEFWYRSNEDNNGEVEFLVSQMERVGFDYAPEAIDGISFAIDDGTGNNTVTSGAGVPLTNISVATISSRCTASGFTLQDIYTIDQQIILYLVEYANMNIQDALGDGCSACYRQNNADVVSNVRTVDGVTVLDVPYAEALMNLLVLGAQVDFNYTGGTDSAIVTAATNDGTTITVTLDREMPSAIEGRILHVHGFISCELPLIGNSIGNASGYLGTAGLNNAFYRGALLYANRYSYVLGAYRQRTTQHIWLCPKDLKPSNYTELNTSVHIDTGVALPDVSFAGWNTVGRDANRVPGISAFLTVNSNTGTNASPTGDRQYIPLKTSGNTITLFGGHSNVGWTCGAFCASWAQGASISGWYYAGLPILKTSL